MYLGFILDSQEMIVKVTPEKAVGIKEMCKLLYEKRHPTIREVAKVISTLVSACHGVKHGSLYYRQLENEKIVALKNHKGNFDSVMSISKKGRADLMWWITHIDESYNHVVIIALDVTLESDASFKGLGGHNKSTGENCGSEWSPHEITTSSGINDMEMKSVF